MHDKRISIIRDSTTASTSASLHLRISLKNYALSEIKGKKPSSCRMRGIGRLGSVTLTWKFRNRTRNPRARTQNASLSLVNTRGLTQYRAIFPGSIRFSTGPPPPPLRHAEQPRDIADCTHTPRGILQLESGIARDANTAIESSLWTNDDRRSPNDLPLNGEFQRTSWRVQRDVKRENFRRDFPRVSKVREELRFELLLVGGNI